jgi:single-strand DNA-binding protein
LTKATKKGIIDKQPAQHFAVPDKTKRRVKMLNQVTILGRLGNDPEVVTTKSGMTLCKMSIATDRITKSGEGRVTDWHRITLFGKQAESAGKYLKKGSTACIQGKIQYSKYTNKDGATVYSTEIVGDRVIFVGGGNGSGETSHEEERYEREPVGDDVPF